MLIFTIARFLYFELRNDRKVDNTEVYFKDNLWISCYDLNSVLAFILHNEEPLTLVAIFLEEKYCGYIPYYTFEEYFGQLNTPLYRTVKFHPLCMCVCACTHAKRKGQVIKLLQSRHS